MPITCVTLAAATVLRQGQDAPVAPCCRSAHAMEPTPLHLLQYDASEGKFHLGEEACAALERISGPVGVVAGKSPFLTPLALFQSRAAMARTLYCQNVAPCCKCPLRFTLSESWCPCSSAVCGRARQGKSYILNQLLGQSSGFKVAATHRPCTKGTTLALTRSDNSNNDHPQHTATHRRRGE